MAVNFAIIGTGNIAQRALAPAVKNVEGARLWSVLSRDQKRAEEFAKRHGAMSSKPAYASYTQLLEDPKLDAVIIATPDKIHAKQGIEAAQAAKHVLVEKPMVTNQEDGQRLTNICREQNVKLGVAYHLRWHSGHRKLAQNVHEGKLGVLHHMRVQWTNQAEDDSNWRAHQEVGHWWSLAAMGTHGLDLIRWMMVPNCGEVTEVESIIGRDFWRSPHDEMALVMLKFESGATAELVTSVLFSSVPAMDIYGRKGMAICRSTLGPHGKGDILINGDKMEYGPVNPYEGEVADFVQAIDENRSPEVDGREGLQNVKILLQAAFS